MTPEGRVKAAVNKLLQPYIDSGYVYKFMPVQAGFGKKTLDYLLCVKGKFVAIETKAPGKKPTPLQKDCMDEIAAADGAWFVVSGDTSADLAVLKAYLEITTGRLDANSSRKRAA